MALAKSPLGLTDCRKCCILYIWKRQNKSKLAYQRDEHRVHLIVYHLIWCPKRRKPILVGGLKEVVVRNSLKESAKEKGWNILTLAIQPDHIHLFVRVWPSDSASEVVKETQRVYILLPPKGISSQYSRSFHLCGHARIFHQQRVLSSVPNYSGIQRRPRKEFEMGLWKERGNSSIVVKVWTGTCWSWIKVRITGRKISADVDLGSPQLIRHGQRRHPYLPSRTCFYEPVMLISLEMPGAFSFNPF